MSFSFVLSIIFGSLLVSCNPYGDSGDSSVDSQFGSENGGQESDSSDDDSHQETSPTPTPTAIPVDQLDDDNSLSGFGGGDHTGTVFSNGVLTLSTATNNAELDESWTPQWNSLVSYWKFDETSWNGTVNEVADSKGSNHGVRVGNATTTSSAKIGNYAGIFDGTGDYINFGDVDQLEGVSQLSISAWVLRDDGTKGNIIQKGSYYNSNASWFFGDHSNASWISFSVSNSNYFHPSASREIQDIWQHVGVVYDMVNSRLELWVNGELEGSGLVGGSFVSIPSTAENLIVGSGFKGKIDDLAVWTTALTSDEIALIYSRQSAKYAGQMQSRIMNSRSVSSSWSNLDWLTTLPFGKELPTGGGSSNSESSESYSEISTNSLMDGLVGLWYLNETSWNGTANEVQDSSGQSHSGVRSGNASTTSYGKFQRAGTFDGNGDYVTLSWNEITGNSARAISAWIRTTSTATVNWISWGNAANNEMSALGVYTQEIGFMGYANDLNIPLADAYYPDGNWHHFAMSFDGSTMKLFFDGKNLATGTKTLNTASSNLLLGASVIPPGYYFNGDLDEVAIWNRALSDSEMLELYRRGANRVKYQIRTCASSNCSDQDALTGDGWKGPGGNYLTYFSELYNNSSVTSSCSIPQQCYTGELTLAGDVQTGSPSMIFNQFGSDGISVDNNQYFQYRVILESDDENTACSGGTTTCLPEVESVEIGPQHSYQP